MRHPKARTCDDDLDFEADLRVNGVCFPLIVSSIATSTYDVIDGERRYCMMRSLRDRGHLPTSKLHIPCLIMEVQSEAHRAMLRILSNSHVNLSEEEINRLTQVALGQAAYSATRPTEDTMEKAPAIADLIEGVAIRRSAIRSPRRIIEILETAEGYIKRRLTHREAMETIRFAFPDD